MKKAVVSFFACVLVFSALMLNSSCSPVSGPSTVEVSEESFVNTGLEFSSDSAGAIYTFGSAVSGYGVSIPASYDIAKAYPYFGPVRDQKSQNSCVGHTLAQYMTYTENKLAGVKNPKSTAEIYSSNYIYNQLCGGLNKGVYMRDAIRIIQEQGDATLATMKDSTTSQSEKPSPAAQSEAATHKVESWMPIENLDDIKAAVAAGNPVVIGIACPLGIQLLTAKNDYYPDVSAFTAAFNPLFGGHALLVVGYDDVSFLVMSSWGTAWAKNGVGRIGYPAMKWILREAYILDNSISNIPISPVDWSETFDDAVKRAEWKVGTNNSPYASLENYVVSGGSLRQTKTVTNYRDPVTLQWTDGFSSLVKSAPVSTKRLKADSVVTVTAKVGLGERNAWFKRVGPVSFGFNLSSLGTAGKSHAGSVWIQNAFGPTSAQEDSRKVMGLYMDGVGISPWDGPKPFDGFCSLLSVDEVARMQPGKVLEFKIVIDISTSRVTGYLKFEGNTGYTQVGTWFSRDLGDFQDGPLLIQPIVGCVGTICAFEEISVEST